MNFPCQQVTTVGVANQQLLPGIRVPEVVRAGVADRNGIASGDVILKVNDVAMGTARDEVDRLVKDIKVAPVCTRPSRIDENTDDACT